ncbi:hypothetical protein [Xanthomonas phaseoli]|uniref:Uncharacterized protein n=1 Tax=Xanthomonas manihotis TaxID=43353 RepID=A0A8I2BVE7_XANMN|nr:hypothetical protein [Xanthomonas phaseoli]KUF22496.1 hypothetical protein AO826_13480 [Xanthomonas phaseoli pv. manihotis]MBO9718629.1 hypothetical protein [Xanthomonas phaseoli pv. manihotis]MBO9755811.1 hypothetical protein [Xanthomonas phaseoli pv. manihotis]MBO9760033.1 hypothetical protein [Xanthomonas phaseoli pv. manihotis]MBO9763223.1 hypothetical protein [Xanthomonas phaseoli pv. manihotis]
MTEPLQRNTLLLAVAQLTKAGLKIIAAAIYACFAASFFSGIVLFIPFLFFGGFVVLFIFFVTSFVMGLPAFLMVGVPVLHWIPALKSARPRDAALAGAVSAAIVDCYIYWAGFFPDLTRSSKSAPLFFGSTIVWAAFAGWLYQRARKHPKTT